MKVQRLALLSLIAFLAACSSPEPIAAATATRRPLPTAEPTQVITLDDLAEGQWDARLSVARDPGNQSRFIYIPTQFNLELLWEPGAEGISVSIAGDAPWINLSGSFNEDHSVVASGQGFIAGFDDVQAKLVGYYENGVINGELTFGGAGGLREHQPITYSFTAEPH